MRPKRATTSGTRIKVEPLSVLVVDDHQDTREMLAEMLGHVGMHARTCGSIADALEAVRARRPDAVLTDLALGGDHGRDLARTLRADPSTAMIAVIAISGEVEPTFDVVRYFDAYLRKPVELAIVPELVRAVIATSRGSRGSTTG